MPTRPVVLLGPIDLFATPYGTGLKYTGFWRKKYGFYPIYSIPRAEYTGLYIKSPKGETNREVPPLWKSDALRKILRNAGTVSGLEMHLLRRDRG